LGFKGSGLKVLLDGRESRSILLGIPGLKVPEGNGSILKGTF